MYRLHTCTQLKSVVCTDNALPVEDATIIRYCTNRKHHFVKITIRSCVRQYSVENVNSYRLVNIT